MSGSSYPVRSATVPRPTASRPRRRVLLLGTAAASAVLVAVIGVEIVLARRAPESGEPPPALDGLVGTGPGPALDVVWLGDSTAAGVGAGSAAGALPTLVAEGLDRPVRLRVLARSGATVADVLEAQLPAVPPGADLVLVSVGANDVTHLTGRDDFERQYRELVERLPGSVPVVLLGIPDMGAIPRLAQPLRWLAGVRGGRFDDVVQAVARSTGAAYVDIAGATGPAFRREPQRYFADDGYHPSAEGYRRWSRAVLGVVTSAMLVP